MSPIGLMTPIEAALDLARWAPSGDNTQPWRFEILDSQRCVIHGFDTRAHCVYDLDGHASHLAHGALLETLAIAATTLGCRADIAPREGCPDTHPLYDVKLIADAAVTPDPLAAHIVTRTVQRRPMSARPLTAEEKAALEAAVAPDYRVHWIEGWAPKLRMARFLSANGKLRLTLPEAYPTHRDVIEWGATTSEDRIPDRAIGLDPLTLKLMRWVMASWNRVDIFNRWLMGTIAPRIQLDFVPALACGAHALLLADRAPAGIQDYVAAGRVLQRFWLTADRLGLRLQPEMTPLIFSRYVRAGLGFTQTRACQALAASVAGRLEAATGAATARQAVFLARLGHAAAPPGRSLRRSWQALVVRDTP
jgi:nitroreductase